MKTPFLLLALAPVLAAAAQPGAAAETETFRWKECPDAVKGLAIQAFMETVVAEDLVVYSLQPGKFSGTCARADAPSIERDLVEDEIVRTAKENERRRAAARRETGGPDPRIAAASRFSFALDRLLDPDREIWFVHEMSFLGGHEDHEVEDGARAGVTFEGTARQGLLVDGQFLKGLLLPTGVVVTTNVIARPAADGGDPVTTREIHRLRRYEWVEASKPREPAFEPATPLPVYFRTYGINYLNAPTIFPLWLKARGGRFEVKRNFLKACGKCGGKGRWTEWKKTAQTIVSCPACAGTGSVGVEKTYVILPDESTGGKSAAVTFE
ncbi:MAG: hypothetical protein IJL06_11570 [Kiritimatiellae bacterium]|nr:hypothetical protein [Kiritimatiellia bacterium]